MYYVLLLPSSGRTWPELGLLLMVESVCRIDALIKYYVLLIDLAVFSKAKSA